MPLINTLKNISADLKLSDKMLITHLNSPSVFEASNGMIGTTIALQGVPFDTEQNEILNQCRRLWKQALTGLQETIALHVTIHRHAVNPLLGGHFPDSFTHTLNQRYEEKLGGIILYENTLYLTVIYKGFTSGKSGKLLHKLTRLSETALKQARAQHRLVQMQALEKVVLQLTSLLSRFGPRVLGMRDKEVGHSELLAFLGLVVNGGKTLPFVFPTTALPLSASIANSKKEMKRYPTGHLGQYLSRYRLFFGKAIQFQGNSEDDNRFAALISIKRYPSETLSLLLDALLHVDAEFIATHTFAIESRGRALDLVEKQATRLNSVDDAGQSQIQSLNYLRDGIASGEDILGHHHHTVMVLADSLPALDKKVNDIIRLYGESGIAAIREDLGLEAAFFAQIPTQFKYIARSMLISGDNFTDFCPLHNYRTGYRDGNHLGSAVTLLETPAKTPYFFNFHTASTGNSVTPGHTMMIGGNGAGKTALMTFLNAQSSRYNGRTFVFDRKRGFEIYIRACGGYYTSLSPDNPASVQFNPFQLDDIPSNRKFCLDWLAQLVKEEGEESLPQMILTELKACVDYAYEQLALSHRVLSHVVKLLPITFSRWPHLRRWLRASDKHSEGEYAYLFDNPRDTFSIHTKMGFDLTHFLDNEPSAVRTAVMMYIMHRLTLSMDGTLLSIYMDEGWQYFQDAYWLKKMSMFLSSIRSKNGHLVFATQAPHTVISSSIHPIIMANIATQILFCNDKATEEDYVNGFKLTQEEFEAIRHTPVSSRLFLVKQGMQSVLCRLNLSGLTDLLPILSPSEKELGAFDAIRKETGDNPQQWQPLYISGVGQ